MHSRRAHIPSTSYQVGKAAREYVRHRLLVLLDVLIGLLLGVRDWVARPPAREIPDRYARPLADRYTPLTERT